MAGRGTAHTNKETAVRKQQVTECESLAKCSKWWGEAFKEPECTT
jgi:hypothetical protein